MQYSTIKRSLRFFLAPIAAITLFMCASANAQVAPNSANNNLTASKNPIIKTTQPPTPTAKPALMPVYTAYRGINIGMTADEVRKSLSHLRDKGDTQDFFVLSDNESAQIFYDKDHKVTAISVDYIGSDSGAPSAEQVIGQSLTAKPDGSIYQLIRYPNAGYWVSYCRTAGSNPTITVTMQKL